MITQNSPQNLLSRDTSTKYSSSIKPKKNQDMLTNSQSNTFFDIVNLDAQNPNNISKKKKREIARKLAESPFIRNTNSNSKLNGTISTPDNFSSYNLLIKNPFKHHMRVTSISPPPTGNAIHLKELSLLQHRVCKYILGY